MKLSKQQTMAKITIGVFFILLLNFNSFSYWVANYSDNGFNGDGESMSNYVALGAGYFLDSYSNTLLFMKKTELGVYQGMSYEELGKILDSALSSMNTAIDTYANLKQAADRTPYNPFVIASLKSFNYASFQEEQGLDANVFSEVKMYLVNGDIRGVYVKVLSDAEKIRGLLLTVKASIDEGQFPELNDVWNLNQTFSRALCFGQYVSMVFYNALN
jgi:hypothetical protein